MIWQKEIINEINAAILEGAPTKSIEFFNISEQIEENGVRYYVSKREGKYHKITPDNKSDLLIFHTREQGGRSFSPDTSKGFGRKVSTESELYFTLYLLGNRPRYCNDIQEGIEDYIFNSIPAQFKPSILGPLGLNYCGFQVRAISTDKKRILDTLFTGMKLQRRQLDFDVVELRYTLFTKSCENIKC